MVARGQGREAAHLLRHELGLGSGYVDVFRVVAELGIELYISSFEDGLDGAYKRVRGRDFIFVQPRQASGCATQPRGCGCGGCSSCG